MTEDKHYSVTLPDEPEVYSRDDTQRIAERVGAACWREGYTERLADVPMLKLTERLQ